MCHVAVIHFIRKCRGVGLLASRCDGAVSVAVYPLPQPQNASSSPLYLRLNDPISLGTSRRWSLLGIVAGVVELGSGLVAGAPIAFAFDDLADTVPHLTRAADLAAQGIASLLPPVLTKPTPEAL